ncbi:carboxypeptidase regulatory-like domain-containing protein [bacterium]|nr:carboxypeptidase regulatory-like domain-containing protein [bacterium]
MRVASILLLLAFVVTAAFAVDNTTLKDSRYDEHKQAIHSYKLGNQLTERQHEILTVAGVIGGSRNELDRMGGPDEYGYYFFDSDEANGPAYDWLDITETGEALAIPFDDDYTGPFALGFDFEFYGNTYDQFFLGSNGMIGFSEDAMWDLGNQQLPTNRAPNNLNAWWWRDMDPGAGENGMAYMENMGDFTVIQLVDWDQYPGGPDQENINAEILLYESGDIVIQYHSMTPNLNRDFVTIGIENAEGTDGLEYCYNNAGNTPQAETAVGFTINEGGFGDPNANVDGFVTDACSGDPVEGAEVWYSNNMAMTDGEGYYMLEGVYNRHYNVEIFADGYPDVVMGADLVEGDNTVDFELEPFSELAVDPEQLTFDVGWLASDSDIITLANLSACGADVPWDSEITYVEDEEVTAMRQFTNAYLRNRIVEAGNFDPNLPATTEIAAYPNTPTTPQASELDDPYFLIIQDGNAWGAPAHQTILDQLMVPYDMINSGQMANHELDEYTCIIFTSVQSQNFLNTVQNNEERFTEFMEDGGWIIFGGCTQNYNWNLWGMSNTYGGDGIGVNNMPDHPIMEGMPEEWTGNWDSHDYINNVPDDANVITVSGVGNPTLIETEFGRGTLLLSTMTWEIGWNQNPMWGNGDVLINTIAYAVLEAGNGGWLTIEPADGVLAPDELVDIDIIVDASAVELPGVYEASIDFIYDGGDEGPTMETVWITMTVGDPGTLEGIVYDSDSGNPIMGAEVVIWGDLEEPVAELETDENGYYVYPLGTGEWTVWSNAPGYYPSDMLTADLIEGEVTVLDIPLDHEIPQNLVVDPEMLDFEVPWLGNDADIITLSNIDAGLPGDWSATVTYIEEEMAAVGNNRADRIQRTVDAWIERSGVLDHAITVYPNENTRSGNEPQTITDPSVIARTVYRDAGLGNNELDDMNVLVYAATDPNTHGVDVVAKLEGTELFESVTILDARNVVASLEELMEFDAVLSWSDWGYVDPTAIGNVFADYVDEGYGVVTAIFETGDLRLGGRWQAEEYFAFPVSWVNWGPPETLGEVFDPGHPIMDGVETFDGGEASFRQDTNQIVEGATRIADWTDGRCLVATREDLDAGYTVSLGMFPPSSDVYFSGWIAGTDGDLLMANALAFAGGGAGWISLEPDGGHIDIDEVVDIDIMVDAIDVELPGVYEAVIDFNVSYPDTLDPATVWVTLVVRDPGTLEGIVSDSETGDPIAGAEVVIWAPDAEEPIAELETDEEGHYIYPLGEGSWDVYADAHGYYPSGLLVADLIEGEVTIMDIPLDHEIPQNLEVTPDQLTFTVNWGEQDSDVVTLSNYDGGLDAEWGHEVVYLEEEMANLANRADLLQRRQANLDNIDLIQPYDITGSSPNARQHNNGEVWQSELDEGPYLVLHTTSIGQSLQRALNELEVENVTYMNTQAWAGLDFEGYNTIMIAMDGGVPSVGDWNAVTDWCRAGGTLMLFGGTASNEPHTAFAEFCPTDGQVGWWISAPPHVNIVDPGSSLIEGLEDGTAFAEQGAGFYSMRFLEDDLEIGSMNGDGFPNIFAKEVDAGNFLCFTSSAADGYWRNQQDFDVYLQVVTNFLNYSGGGWITIDPEDGFLAIDEEVDIDVLVDAVPDSLFGGVYEAFINFNVDYPDTLEPATVWVTFEVIGGPPRHQWIPLQPNYFEMISMNLNPERFNIAAEEMFGPLGGLYIAYQNNGDVFVPPDVNSIGDVDFHQGYRLYTDGEEDIVHVLGDLLEGNVEYSFTGGTWKWIGYPYDFDVPVDVALSAVEDEAMIVLNDEGHLWIPGVLNTMGTMTPGEGYMAFFSEDVTFEYAGMDVLAARGGSNEQVMPTPVVESAPVATGLPYAVLVEFSEETRALEPAVVEIYDGNIMVGKAVVQEDYEITPVITWEGSVDHGLQGFKAGNPMSVVVRDASGNKLPMSGTDMPMFGEGAYATVSLEQSMLPTEFSVAQGYPNPFNPSVTVPFALPKAGKVSFEVYNVLGQQVFSQERAFEAGVHRFLFDTQTKGHDLVSGVYFLNVQYQGQTRTQKLMLLK